MIIAFSGCSGAGKSTLVKRVINSTPFKGKNVAIKEDDDFLHLKLLKLFFGEKIFSDYKNSKKFSRENNTLRFKFFSAFTYIFYPMFIYLEYLWDHIYYEIIFRKKILIRDRYIYDYIVTFKENLNISNKINYFFYKNFPRPYLMFFVSINLATAKERNCYIKSEGWEIARKNFLKDVLKSYSKIAEDKNMIKVNAVVNPNLSVSEINRYIEDKNKLLKIKKIIICGMDGAGKTTVAKMLLKYVEKLSIPCALVHFYHDNILFKLLKKVGIIKRSKENEAYYRKTRARTRQAKKEGKSFIWAMAHFLDSCIQHVFFSLINTGKLIVFDRYFYDYLVSFRYLGVGGSIFFEKLIPNSGAKFLLTTKPEIAQKRKPENTIDFFRESKREYEKIARKLGLVEINTERKNPEEILNVLLSKLPSN